MLGGVADDGDQDQTDELLAEMGGLDEVVDGSYHVVGAVGDEEGDEEEEEDEGGCGGGRGVGVGGGRGVGVGVGVVVLVQGGEGGVLFFQGGLGLEELLVGVKGEEEIQAVEEEENGGDTPRQSQDAGLYLVFVVVVIVVGFHDGAVQGGGYDGGSRGEGHERAGSLRGARREALLPADAVIVAHVSNSAEEEAHA